MFHLDKYSTFRDIANYVMLCKEHNIKKVVVNFDVYQLIKQVECSKLSYLILSNVRFELNQLSQ